MRLASSSPEASSTMPPLKEKAEDDGVNNWFAKR